MYLAHLNPVTKAHVEIISYLKDNSDSVKVMPVVFRNGKTEVNSRSFPFSFEVRLEMLRSVFGNSITITGDYTFYAPFKRYMPPLLSPMSWRLRRQILRGVDGCYFSYTGDKAEGYMLRLYRLKPRIGKRRSISATSVKEQMYSAAITQDEAAEPVSGATPSPDSSWTSGVPDSVAQIITAHWNVVKRFASAEDTTTRMLGMKFPKLS